MKTNVLKIRIFSAALLLLCFVMTLASCMQNDQSNRTKNIRTFFQPLGIAVSSEDGFYHLSRNSFLYFFDYKTQQDVLVCGKADCKHRPWSENTPAEERCNAYVDNYPLGFVKDQTLYLMNSDFTAEKPVKQIHASNLDRSESKVIAKFESGELFHFALEQNRLFIVVNTPRFEKQEDGSIEQTHQNTSNLLAVDLKTGEVRKTIEDRVDYNNELKILSADGEKIYMLYGYFDKMFDGTNFQESGFHSEYFVFDIKTQELRPILNEMKDNEAIYMAVVKGDEMLALAGVRDEQGIDLYKEIRKYHLTDHSMSVIARCEGVAYQLGSSIFCPAENNQGYIEVSLDSEEIIEHKKMNIPYLYPLVEAGDYFFVIIQKPGAESGVGFIRREDLFAGETDSIIEAHY